MQGENEYAEDSSDEEVGWATAAPLQGGLCGHRRPEWASWRGPKLVWKSSFRVGDT